MTAIQCCDVLSLLDLENTLKCPVCFELRDGHVYSCVNGHHLCRVCRESLINCPICQNRLSDCRNFVVESLITRYEFVMETIDQGQATENQEHIFDFSTSDFATVVKTTAFVDKTLMIKDIFKSSSKILITAPPRFGKSTNLNMVKRFVEIQLDEYGRPSHHDDAIHETVNYKLFKDNNLEISKYDEFFNEHFGRYPVIYTDWKALNVISNFTSVIDVFRRITVETFSYHTYLLDRYLRDNEDIINFRKYFCDRAIKEMDVHDLICGFKILSRFLYKHHNKKVFVLIDSYDAFLNSMLFNKNTDTDKIITFINTVIGYLLQNNHCVGRAVVTGVIPLTGDGFALNMSTVDCYPFLDNHPFCKYYGLTCVELDKILDKLERDEEEKTAMKRVINKYYNNYFAKNQSVRIYNIWSVLQYVCKRKVRSSWYSHECFSSLKSAFFNNFIRGKVGQLLCDGLLQLDMLQPLSCKDVLQLNDDSRGDRVFLMFYHLGCLSVNRALGRGFVELKIPNEEIKYELAKLFLVINYRHEFVNNVKQVWSAIDSFRPDVADLSTTLLTFVETLQDLSCSEWIKLYDPHCYLIGLFIGLITIPECKQIVATRLGPEGLMVVLLRNKENVAFCITAEKDVSYNPTDTTRRKTAENAHKRIINSYRNQVFGESDDQCGKVLITVGYSTCSSHSGDGFNVSITYSYHFKTGDSLQEYRTL